jgi:CRISPR-associated Csx2 family protein
MAKILISSLGLARKEDGTYKKAKYSIDNKIYETSFIADALTQHLNIDKLFLIGTKKSIWDEAYVAFGGDDEEYQLELYEKKEDGCVDNKSLSKFNTIFKNGSKSFIVDYGLNDNEIWDNFEKFLEIADFIEDGDELYLDITHSFRSLSLMSFVMTQFATSISEKKFKIKGLFYGMFEYSFESADGTTPIVDIKILLEIQTWIKAIDAIKSYSDFDPLVRLLEQEDIEKNVNNAFVQLNNSIKMVNLAALEIFIKNAAKKVKSISSSSNKIIKLLAPEIIKLIEELDTDVKSKFQYGLAKWFFKNKNYGLSYLALYESIISKSCEFKDYDVEEHKLREEAKHSIGDDKWGQYFYTKRGNSKFKNSISNIRNAIAHQNSDRKELVMEDITRLEKYINTFESYIFYKQNNKSN